MAKPNTPPVSKRKEKGFDRMSLIEKVKELKIGQEFKSYRAVCQALGESVKNGGKSKEAQMKEWARYFNHRKDGNKWIITELYHAPLDKYDGRSLLSGGSVYTDDLQTLILMLADMQGKKNNLLITRNNLIMQLGLVNVNYKTGKHYPLGMEEVLNVESEVLSDFFTSTDRNLKRMIETAMNKLDKKSLIRWRKARVLKRNGEEESEVATREEDERILEVERRVMDELGCKDEAEVIFRGFSQTYYNQVVMTLNNEYNFNLDYYFRAYEIIYSKKFIQMELNKLPLEDRQMASKRLNQNLQNNLCTNAKNRQRRVRKKLVEHQNWTLDKSNMGLKPVSLSAIEMARNKETYIESTQKLIQTTINPKEEDKGDLIIKKHYEVIERKSKGRSK